MHFKPDRYYDHSHDDGAPDHWRHPFRAPASGRNVGGAIELLIHVCVAHMPPPMIVRRGRPVLGRLDRAASDNTGTVRSCFTIADFGGQRIATDQATLLATVHCMHEEIIGWLARRER